METTGAVYVILTFKVETIGDAYEVVSGAPIASKFHAVYAADMAFDMIEATKALADPSRPGESLKIRLGMLASLPQELVL